MRQLRLALLGFAAAAAAILTGACSGAPAPAPPTSRGVSWLCSAAPLDIALQAVGVPAGSRPIDLALSAEKVSILLSPARIVTFARTDPKAVDMIVGREDSPWRAIDRDPTDGSLWVASDETVSLLHISETGERSVVPGPTVEGRGGFRQIRVTRAAIYAAPTAAQSGVWRLSRTGELLGQAFPRTDAEDTANALHPSRGVFWMARDLDGNVVVFDVRTGRLQRAETDGTWAALPDRFPAHPPTSGRSLRGQEVGTPSESWYFTDDVRGFFFAPGGPTLLGSGVAGVHSHGTVLFRVREGRIETSTENCTRTSLQVVVSDSLGFAAISGEMVETTTTGERRALSSHVLLGRYSPGK
jgi:hypothetical protein